MHGIYVKENLSERERERASERRRLQGHPRGRERDKAIADAISPREDNQEEKSDWPDSPHSPAERTAAEKVISEGGRKREREYVSVCERKGGESMHLGKLCEMHFAIFKHRSLVKSLRSAESSSRVRLACSLQRLFEGLQHSRD